MKYRWFNLSFKSCNNEHRCSPDLRCGVHALTGWKWEKALVTSPLSLWLPDILMTPPPASHGYAHNHGPDAFSVFGRAAWNGDTV